MTILPVHGYYLVRALVMLSPSDFVVDSLDQIEFRARKIFRDLMNLDRCVILMDEMDALLQDREWLRDKGGGSMIEFVVPALLPKIQELRDYSINHNVAVFFATNYYERIDRALSRKGRIDEHILVLPYSRKATMDVAERAIKRRAPDKKVQHLKTLETILSAVPCYLAYQDVQRIVTAVVDGQSSEDIIKSAQSLGVAPRTYDLERRKDCYRELYAFLRRLNNEESPNHEELLSISQEKVAEYCYHVSLAIKKINQDSLWIKPLKEWQEILSHGS